MNFHGNRKHMYLSLALKIATIQDEPKRAEMK